MSFKVGDAVWGLRAGSLFSGVFNGYADTGNLGIITTNSYNFFINLKFIYETEGEAKDAQFLKRLERLQSLGVPLENIVTKTDKETIDRLMEECPEKLLKF